jgi:glucuronate isomerase
MEIRMKSDSPIVKSAVADRYFSPEASTRNRAGELYEEAGSLPLICPHGHVDPYLFANPDVTLESAADLFIILHHYITRMLYSQGIPLESLLEGDHRAIWQLYCEIFISCAVPRVTFG